MRKHNENEQLLQINKKGDSFEPPLTKNVTHTLIINPVYIF